MNRVEATFSNPYFRQVVSSTVTYSVGAVALGAIGLQTLPLAPAALLGATIGSVIYVTNKFLIARYGSIDNKLLKANVVPTFLSMALAGAVFLGAPLIFSATLLVVLTEPCVRDVRDLAKAILNIEQLDIVYLSLSDSLKFGLVLGSLSVVSSVSLRILGFPALPFLPALSLGVASGIGVNILSSLQSSADRRNLGDASPLIIPVLANRLIGAPFTGPAVTLAYIGFFSIAFMIKTVATIIRINERTLTLSRSGKSLLNN